MTLYEIIGMIKDKKPVKKFKAFDEIFEWDDVLLDYFDLDGCSLFSEYAWADELDTKVEILEITISTNSNETKVPLLKKRIKELEIYSVENNPTNMYILNNEGVKCYMTKHSREIALKVNELIREVNKISERI